MNSNPSTLSQSLREHIAAAFTGLWIQSREHEEALREIGQLCQDNSWQMASWDVDRGLQVAGQSAGDAADPVAAVRSLAALAPEDPAGSSLLVLPNFHRFLQSAEVIQTLAHAICEGRTRRCFLVILSPVVQLPAELEKLFVVLEHPLPAREQLAGIAEGVATEEGEMPAGADRQRLLEAAAGLTRFEAENAFALSLVRHGRLQPETIWEIKESQLKTSGLLRLHRGEERFETLGGLGSLKEFCRRALQPSQSSVHARGILLLGLSGTGKSAFAKALGNETGRPTLVLDVGSLMGSLVGQSEANIRRALQIADAMAPAVLFIDEVEKALAGTTTSGRTDSGVSARLFGSLLTWLSDHTSDVFVVCTANDVRQLPPEFSRAERFDGIFFLDLPGAEEKEAIWRIYIEQFGLPEQPLPEGTDWTGAEIRSCCRLANLLDVPLTEAAEHVVPVAATAAESVDQLRRWAAGRCLRSDGPGIYRLESESTRRRSRRVSRPSASLN